MHIGSGSPRGCGLLLALALLMPSALAAGCQWQVGWTLYPVYTYPGPDDSVRGADVEILAAVAGRVGCRLRFRQLPWKRILLEIEQGRLDVTSSASRTPERIRFASFSRPYRQAATAVYVRAGEENRHRLKDLASLPATDFRLGVVAGYYYGPRFQALLEDPAFRARVEEAPDYQTNILKLLHGRIDGFLVDDAGVLVAKAREMGVADKLARHPLSLPGEALHLMFSEDRVDPATLAAVDAAILALDREGALAAILDRHLRLDTGSCAIAGGMPAC